MTLGIGKDFLRGFTPYYIEGLFSHLCFQKRNTCYFTSYYTGSDFTVITFCCFADCSFFLKFVTYNRHLNGLYANFNSEHK